MYGWLVAIILTDLSLFMQHLADSPLAINSFVSLLVASESAEHFGDTLLLLLLLLLSASYSLFFFPLPPAAAPRLAAWNTQPITMD
jgi:hypothetical protein